MIFPNNLRRNELPAITQTEGTSVLDLANQFRERYFLDADPSLERWKYRYDSVVMQILDTVGGPSFTSTQPRYEWNEMSRFEVGTTLEVEINTSAEYLKLKDPGIANVGQDIFCAATGEYMLVIERDMANGLSGDTNIRVKRAQYGTVAASHAAGASFIAQAAYMGERDIPRDGTGTQPGLSQYNLISLYGRTYSATRLNDNTVIRGEWGQMERERFFNLYALRREVAYSLLFGPRWVESAGDRGPLYRCGGISHFVKSNVVQLGDESSNQSWEVFNGIARNVFAADASGSMKIALNGRLAFRNYKELAREHGRLSPTQEGAIQLGEESYVIDTDDGPIRMVLAKNDLNQTADYQLGDWTFILDPQNIRRGTVAGFESEVIVPDVQEKKQGITINEDAIVGSVALAVMFEDTHAIIKGAPAHFLNRAKFQD